MSKSESRSFTTTIFLNTKSEYDVFRFNHVLSPSIRFLKNKILVVPECRSDLNVGKDYRMILDREILGSRDFPPAYKKQHLLKLFIAKLIPTTHYLILDSDIYVNQRFRFEDFFFNGKITLFIYDGSMHLHEENYEKDCHTKWLLDTLKFYGRTIDDVHRPFCYGVTPALFITKEAKEVVELLDSKHPDFVELFKNDPIGMEYSHYYLHVDKKNLYYPGTWKKWVSAVWTTKDSIDDLDDKAVFWVIQSRTKIDKAIVMNLLKNKSELKRNAKFCLQLLLILPRRAASLLRSFAIA